MAEEKKPQLEIVVPDVPALESDSTPTIEIEKKLILPSPEQAHTATRTALKKDGFTVPEINDITRPTGWLRSLPDWLEPGNLWNTVRPASFKQFEQAAKMGKNLADRGRPLTPEQDERMRAYFEKMGGAGINADGAAEAIDFWAKVREKAARAASGILAQTHADFSVGLGMLDVATEVNKRWKLLHIPANQRAEVEAQVLPKVTLDDSGRTFRNGTTAALYTGTQKLFGIGNLAVGGVGMALKTLTPNMPLGELPEMYLERGVEQSNKFVKEAPAIIASLGPHLPWSEVVERNWDPVTDTDRFWSDLNDMGGYGTMSMGAMAMADAGVEFIYDPFLLSSGVLGRAPRALRNLATAVRGTEETVDVAREAARSTKRFEDAVEAWNAAKQHADAVEREVAEQIAQTKAATGKATISGELTKRRILAQEQVLREQQWLSRFEDPGPNEVIMLRTAQRNPDAVPSVKTTEKYTVPRTIEGPDAAERGVLDVDAIEAELVRLRNLTTQDKMRKHTMPTTKAKFDATKIDQDHIDQQITRSLNRVSEAGVLTDEEATAVGNLVLERKNLQRTVKDMPLGKAREPINARLREVNAGINRTLDKGMRSFVLIREEEKTRPGVKSIIDIADEIHADRKAALERSFDEPVDWNNVEELPLFRERQLMGPDNAEEAGDALNAMTRTGGTAVDDVAIKDLHVEEQYQMPFTPQSKMGLIDWRKIDLHNARVRAEKEFLAKATGQGDFFISQGRVLSRQEDIVRRNLGLARQIKDKATRKKSVKVWQDELDLVRAAKKKIKPDRPAEQFDGSMLPGTIPPRNTVPSRFNSWLQHAGNRIHRGLYPNSTITNNQWTRKISEIFAPLREPQRFYESLDPDAWDRFRSSYLRYHQEVRSWNEDMLRTLEKAGVIKVTGKFNPKKSFAPWKVVDDKNEMLFDMLDTSPIEGSRNFTNKHRGLTLDEMREQFPKEIVEAHDKVRKSLRNAADAQGISDTVDDLPGYIRHVITKDQFSGNARPLEYVGLPASGKVFASHLLDRKGAGGYPRDATLALDLYGRAFNRKRIIEPMFEDIIQTGKELSEKHGKPVYLTYSNDFVSQLQGKPQLLGKKIDEFAGGTMNQGKLQWVPDAIDRVLIAVSGLFWSGALGGNPRYPVMQISTGLATTASRFSLWRTSKALWQMASPEGQAINRSVGTYDSFNDIFEAGFMKNFGAMFAQARKSDRGAAAKGFEMAEVTVQGISQAVAKHGYTVSPFGVMSTAQTEEMIRGVTALASIDMHMTKLGISGWEEARAMGMQRRILFEALRSSEEVNHMFGAMGRSPWASRTLAPTRGVAVSATQFLSFMPKQTEELISQFQRNPGSIAQFLTLSGWMSRMAAQAGGVDITKYVGLGFLPEDLDDVSAPAVDGFLAIIDFVSAASRNDPAAAKLAAKRVIQTGQAMVPLMAAFKAGSRGFDRLATGEQTAASGNKVRDLDFKDIVPQAGEEGFDPIGIAKKVPQALDPDFGERNSTTFGGDIFPTLTGQQSIQENIHRRAIEAARRDQRKVYFATRNAVDDVITAAESRDTIEMNKAIAVLARDHNIRLSSSSPFRAAIEAREIAQHLRMIRENPNMMDRFGEIMQNYGILPRPEAQSEPTGEE